MKVCHSTSKQLQAIMQVVHPLLLAQLLGHTQPNGMWESGPTSFVTFQVTLECVLQTGCCCNAAPEKIVGPLRVKIVLSLHCTYYFKTGMSLSSKLSLCNNIRPENGQYLQCLLLINTFNFSLSLKPDIIFKGVGLNKWLTSCDLAKTKVAILCILTGE